MNRISGAHAVSLRFNVADKAAAQVLLNDLKALWCLSNTNVKALQLVKEGNCYQLALSSKIVDMLQTAQLVENLYEEEIKDGFFEYEEGSNNEVFVLPIESRPKLAEFVKALRKLGEYNFSVKPTDKSVWIYLDSDILPRIIGVRDEYEPTPLQPQLTVTEVEVAKEAVIKPEEKQTVPYETVAEIQNALAKHKHNEGQGAWKIYYRFDTQAD